MSDFVKQNAVKSVFKIGDSWAILSEIERSIKAKIEMAGTPLCDWDVKINYGIKTGCNEAFIIDESKRNEILLKCTSEDERQRTDKIIRPILRGRDISRDGYKWAGLYLIAAHNGYTKDSGTIISRIDINSYPSLKSWFDSGDWNKDKTETNIGRLSSRTDKGETPYNLRDCIYMDDFSKQKIIYSETNSSVATKITIDKSEFFTDKTCFIITGKDDEISRLFNIMSSMVFTWYMNFLSPKLGKSGISLTKDTVELFPAALSIEDYGLSDEEMNFISSSLRPISK